MTANVAFVPSESVRSPVVQRRCACGGNAGPDGECAACKAKRLATQRSAASAGSGGLPPSRRAQAVLSNPGRPLDGSHRREMEHRLSNASRAVAIDPVRGGSSELVDGPGDHFERNAERVSTQNAPTSKAPPSFDFRNVRVHADSTADRAARAIDADAFTIGSNIAFRAGRYDPSSSRGKTLLAHELTHVVQQAGGSRQVQRQSVGDRRVRYEEHVDQTSHKTDDPMSVWKGQMTRTENLEEFKETPAKDKTPAKQEWQAIQSRQGKVNLEFDPRACKVRLPLRLKFQNPSFAAPQAWDPCGLNPANPAPRTPLPNDTFTKLRSAFTSEINTGLNGWYTAKIEGCDKGPCAGKDIPINVEVHDGGAAEERDQDVFLINAKGRSCADQTGAFIYAPSGDTDERMWRHEAGHFLLGYGDEYAEAGKAPERVTHDYSAMGDAEKTRFATFHERHFAFVPVFLNDVLQSMGQAGCKASLQEVSRPLATSFRISLGEGYASFRGGGSGLYVDLGFDLGLAEDRSRAVEKIIGLHARWLNDAGKESTQAFLFGLRLGVERRWGGSGHGLTLGGFGEIGGGAFNVGGTGGAQAGAYGELGGYFGYKPPVGEYWPGVRLEAAGGTRIGTTGQIGEPGGGVPGPNAPMEQWVRLGVNAVWAF